MKRRLAKIELDTNQLQADRIKRIVDTDPEVRALLERWDEAAYGFETAVPPDFRPDLVAVAHLQRQHPHIETSVLIEHLWRREYIRRNDPDLDQELSAIEDRVDRELRGA
ncbi:hypothetical protein BH23CHL2_BH23CHL2_15870 [soil metagenome]